MATLNGDKYYNSVLTSDGRLVMFAEKKRSSVTGGYQNVHTV